MTRARRAVQLAVLALTLLGVFLFRANAEAWCPFGGIEALYTYLDEGNLVCSLGISNFYALAALIVSVLLVRRAFCGWVCPIGTISEWLRALAARGKTPRLRVPARVDRALSLAKYMVLAAVVAAAWTAGELVFRGYCPAYVLLSRHGEDITYWAYTAAGAIVAASLFVDVPFCRWFCPLAAVLNPISRFGLARVKRDAAACSGCGLCAKSCPMAIPIDQVLHVRHARCISCLRCIEACPPRPKNDFPHREGDCPVFAARKSGQSPGCSSADPVRSLFWGPPDAVARRWPPAALAGVVLFCIAATVAAVQIAPLPSFIKSRGEAPERVAAVDLRIRDLTCRGRANLLVGFLNRDDLYQIPGAVADAPGYYRLEAWPHPAVARVCVSYDPRYADEEAVKRAILEPYFDMAENRWWTSPFAIEGYTLPGLADVPAAP